MDYKDEEELEQVEYNKKLANSYYDNFDEEEYNSRLANSYYDDKLLNEPQPDENIPEAGKLNEGPIKDVTAVAKRAAIKSLFFHPITWIIIGIILLIIIIVFLIFQMDFDLHGIGTPSPSYYSAKCNKIYLTWQKETYEGNEKIVTNSALVDLNDTIRYEFEEYDIDTFIAGIIWTDNKNALDVDNLTVYEAMAIVKRSYLIVNIADNCVVLRDYDPLAKNFTKLTGSEDNYSDINGAIANTKGMVIARDGKIIPTEYDAFSYTSKKVSNDGDESDYFYHMMNANEQGEQIISANWVNELEKEKGVKLKKEHVSSVEKFKSLSLYGAKYLVEMIDSQYELYRILENYFGRDIEYMTIDSSFGNNFIGGVGCGAISMNSTSLSREDFIRLASTYGNSKGEAAKTLGDNAGMIYDMAISNGINPELVIVRADVEGYSPGASKNNYWGMGCTNTGGYNACISYSSLADGVAGFLKYISKFSTLNELMSKYAYLGDYWYNPGGWDIGGCKYASAIYGSNIPDHVRNACASGKTCTLAGGDDCVPTTDEDKEAYLTYQSRSMVSARKKIFGLEGDTCESETPMGEPGVGNCTIYKQGDSRWGAYKLGTSNTTMSRSGCAVTSVAIAISCSGVEINDVASFNPGTLVTKMNEMGGFDGANIYWNNSAIKYFAPTFNMIKNDKLRGDNTQKLSQVRNNMGPNKSVILHFKNEQHPRGHFVVLKSISGDNFIVYDPATGGLNTYNVNDLDQIVVYSY